MKYQWIMKPAEFKNKSDDDIIKDIESGVLTQQGVQTFPKETIAKNWAEDAKEKGFICVRRAKHTELYQKKKR